MKQYATELTLARILLSFAIGMAVGLMIANVGSPKIKPERAALQLEFTAYQHCMQSAGRTGCQMTPQDFVRYHDLKRYLNEESPVD